MTDFTPEELTVNIRVNFDDKPAGIINAEHDDGFKTPSRAIHALEDAVSSGWFERVLDTSTRRLDFITKVRVTFQRTWNTARHLLEQIHHKDTEISELKQQLLVSQAAIETAKSYAKQLQDGVEKTAQEVIQQGVQHEEELRRAHQAQVKELETQLTAVAETKAQLEERLYHHDGREQTLARIQEELDELRATKVILDGQQAALVAENRRIQEEAQRNKNSREREIIRLNIELAKARRGPTRESSPEEDERPTPRPAEGSVTLGPRATL